MDLASRLLSLKNAGGAFEIYYAKSSSTKIDSKDQKVDSLTRSEDMGLSFRTVKNGRIGFSFTTSLESTAIERAIDSALQVAAVMPEDPTSSTLGRFSSNVTELKNRMDPDGLALSIEQKIELAKRLERTCRALDRRIQTVRSASFAESKFETELRNHLGQRLTNSGSFFSVSISCKAEENGDAQMGGDYRFSTHLNKLEIDACAKEAAHTATRLLGASMPKTMNCPAVIENGVVGDLIDFLSSSFLGDSIEKGRSMLIGRLGEKVFSEKLNLIDDALLEGGYATRPFDAEGTASQTNDVVRNGVFTQILFDQPTAFRMKASSTGNSSRSIQNPPSIGLTNFYMKPGTASVEELISKAGNGIYLTDLMGVHTANPITGAFSLGASGILIENGKLTRPVKGFAVAGNVLDLFKNIDTLGSDLRFFGSIGAPSFLVDGLQISGA